MTITTAIKAQRDNKLLAAFICNLPVNAFIGGRKKSTPVMILLESLWMRNLKFTWGIRSAYLIDALTLKPMKLRLMVPKSIEKRSLM